MLLYAFTFSNYVLHIDSGELAAVQLSLGVAHPTGYPLFSLLGWLFSKLPLLERPIAQLNLLAALFTALGIGVFAAFLSKVLQDTDFVKSKTGLNQNPARLQIALISIASSVLLGTTLVCWAQATGVEVYSLQICLFALLIWFLYQAWQENTMKSWILASLFLGLSFSNHMTTLMILPMAAILYFSKRGFSQAAFKFLAIPGLVGLGVLVFFYGLMVFRSGSDALIQWGNIHDWTTLKRHLTGHQYSSWIFAGSKVAAKNLGKFLSELPGEWVLVGLVAAGFGFGIAMKSVKVFAYAFLTGMLFNIVYVINYDIKDLEPYFLLAHFAIAFFAAFGLVSLLNKLPNANMAWLFLALPAISASLHFKTSNQKNTHFFEDYAQSTLSSVEPNALLFTQQWDFLITPYYYYRVADQKFTGIMVLDKELMRRSWYINRQAEMLSPNLFKGSETDKEIFLNALKPFEEGRPFDGNTIETFYQAFLGSIMRENFPKRPVYLGLEYYNSSELRIPEGFQLVPMGWWLKLVPVGSAYQPAKIPGFTTEFPPNWKGYYTNFIKEMWSQGCLLRAQYETQFNKPAEAVAWQKAAQRFE